MLLAAGGESMFAMNAVSYLKYLSDSNQINSSEEEIRYNNILLFNCDVGTNFTLINFTIKKHV